MNHYNMDHSPRVRLLAFACAGLLCFGCDLATEPQPYSASTDPVNQEHGAMKQGAFAGWSPALDAESAAPGAHDRFNTDSLEGCPFVSPDGKMFFMASDRDGTIGGLDVWVSTRVRITDPWGEPQNVGAPINTIYNDFCPTLGRDGHTFFFASNRPGYCGTTSNADLYESRLGPHGFGPVKHLGCKVNSGADEHGPFPLNIPGEGPVLFYSSARASGPGDTPGDHDVYMSRFRGGAYRAAERVDGVNTEFNDGQPNLRRDGLELFFYSSRPGSAGNDIYSASRNSIFHPWSAPVNLGPDVNSAASETRPSLSWDGHTLYFGSTRAGSSDIYVTTR